MSRCATQSPCQLQRLRPASRSGVCASPCLASGCGTLLTSLTWTMARRQRELHHVLGQQWRWLLGQSCELGLGEGQPDPPHGMEPDTELPNRWQRPEL